MVLDVPEPLKRFEAARAAIQTADVRWSLMETSSAMQPGETVRYRTLHGGRDVALFPLDQYDGKPLRMRYGDGSIREVHQAPTAHLINAEGVWEYRVNGGVAFQYDVPFDALVPPDVRLIGMSTGLGVTQRKLGDVFGSFDSSVRFTEEMRLGLHVVTAHYTDGASTRYFIDAERGWNAVRVEGLDSNGTLRTSVDTTYELRSGHWFPSFCQSVDERTGEVRYIVEVEDAEINDPTLPARLEPENIGIQDDMTVVAMHRGRKQMSYSDGRLIPRDEKYFEDHRAGRIKQGPKTIEFIKNRGRMTPISIDDLRAIKVERSQDDWERYTLRFIDQYRLDEQQRSDAMLILKRCQTERDQWLREHIDRVDQRLSEEHDRAKARRLEMHLLKPVQRIFEQKLKPQLFRLPTHEQIDESHDPEQVRSTANR